MRVYLAAMAQQARSPDTGHTRHIYGGYEWGFDHQGFGRLDFSWGERTLRGRAPAIPSHVHARTRTRMQTHKHIHTHLHACSGDVCTAALVIFAMHRYYDTHFEHQYINKSYCEH